MTENPRTTTARATDDHELIDAMVEEADTAIVGGGGGGHLQTDVGTQDDLTRAGAAPDAIARPRKADDIANDQAYDSDRGGNGGG